MVLGAFNGACYLCQKKGHKVHVCHTKWVNGGNDGGMNK